MNKYKHIASMSAKKALRMVEQHEKDGWELVCVHPNIFTFLGSGGGIGLIAVVRKSENRTTSA